MDYVNVCHQRGGNDCGLFSIAFATTSAGLNPRIAELQTIFDEKPPPSSYREEFSPSISFHKADCEIMYSFNRTDRSFLLLQASKRWTKNNTMPKCKEWYHVNCVGVTRRDINSKNPWYCSKKINYLEQDNHY